MKLPTLRVLRALDEIQATTSLPATVRQLADRAGYGGHAGVLRHLDKLEADGLVTRQPGVSRSIQITAAGRRRARK